MGNYYKKHSVVANVCIQSYKQLSTLGQSDLPHRYLLKHLNDVFFSLSYLNKAQEVHETSKPILTFIRDVNKELKGYGSLKLYGTSFYQCVIIDICYISVGFRTHI